MIIENFTIEKENSCLIIIDIQERLCNAMKDKIKAIVVKNAGILIETCKAYKIPIIITEQYKKGLGPTIPDIRERIQENEPLEKTTFDCLKENIINQRIHELGKTTFILAGIETHVCVLQTAISLLKNGKNVIIGSNAVCSRRKHDWGMAVEALSHAGAVIYPTETISFMIMGRSGTPEFKELSHLFK